jgi:hypothetical protein
VHLNTSICNCRGHRGSGFPIRLACSALQWLVKPPTMASADFCPPIPPPHDSGSQWPVDRPPRVMRATFTLIPAAFTSAVSVQVPGFEDIGLLTHCDRLLCAFCSSGQCFAFSFLQIPPRDGHPCRSANRSPCRAGSRLSPPSHPVTTTVTGTTPVKALRAMPGAPKKGRQEGGPNWVRVYLSKLATGFASTTDQYQHHPTGQSRWVSHRSFGR